MDKISRRDFLVQTGGVVGGAAILPFLLACGSSPSGSSASSPGSDLASLEAAAKKEGGHIALYIFDAQEGQQWAQGYQSAQGFQSAYPWATVDVTGAPDKQMIAKYLTEFQAGQYVADVIHCVPTDITQLKAANSLATYNVPNDSLIRSDLRDSKGYVHNLYLSLYCLVYNSQLTSAPPADLFALADSKYKGQIAVDNPVHLAVAGPVFASRRALWGDSKWNQWLQGMKDNNLFFVTDAGASFNAVLQGERPIGLTSFKSIHNQPAGAPTKAVFYQNEYVSAYPAYISAKAPHPNTAKLFVNFMLSSQGQQVIVARGLTPSTSINSPLSLDQFLPSSSGKVVTDSADFVADPTSYMKIFQQYWPT